jgi:hypothetical protein
MNADFGLPISDCGFTFGEYRWRRLKIRNAGARACLFAWQTGQKIRRAHTSEIQGVNLFWEIDLKNCQFNLHF